MTAEALISSAEGLAIVVSPLNAALCLASSSRLSEAQAPVSALRGSGRHFKAPAAISSAPALRRACLQMQSGILSTEALLHSYSFMEHIREAR